MNTNVANSLKYKMLQSANMFLVWIPNVPNDVFALQSNIPSNFMLLTRSTSIPQKTSEMTIVKTFCGRFTIPNRTEWDHQWGFKLLMTEDHIEYDALVRWYKLSQITSQFYTDAYIILLDFNNNAKKAFRLKNVYPLEIPLIDALNYDGVDDNVELDCKFSYDDIDYDEGGALHWITNFINGGSFIQNILKKAL